MDDALIRKIVLTVIEQLSNTSINSITDSIFILSNNDNFYFKNELESTGYKLNIASNVKNINIDNYNTIVIDDLSVEILSCIANLIYKDDNISFIINALLSGKRVIGLKNIEKFNNYKQNATNKLFSKLLDLENIAKSYGLIISENKTFLSFFKKIDVKSDIGNTFDLTDKKIITESDILGIINEYSSVVINNKAIITPLVIDYIKDNKINIIYKDKEVL